MDNLRWRARRLTDAALDRIPDCLFYMDWVELLKVLPLLLWVVLTQWVMLMVLVATLAVIAVMVASLLPFDLPPMVAGAISGVMVAVPAGLIFGWALAKRLQRSSRKEEGK